MPVVNISKFKQRAINQLELAIKRIQDGTMVGMAIAEVHNNGDSANLWVSSDRPTTLIGELHCLMSDMEYFEIELRKHQES